MTKHRRNITCLPWLAACFSAIVIAGCTDIGAWDYINQLTNTDTWFDEAWPIRVRFTFDNRGQSEDLDDFPVLVVLNPSRVDYADMAADGSDIRFVDGGSGIVLSHEIEDWNPGGSSHLWVRVPQIDGGSGNDRIWLYYGNGTATSVEDPAAVWIDNFRGVWHLGNTNNSAGGGLNGINSGTIASGGIIAGGRDFNGTTDYIRVPDDPSLDIIGALTMETWVYRRSAPGDRVIFLSKWNTAGDQRSYQVGSDRSSQLNQTYFMVSETGFRNDPEDVIDSPGPEPTLEWIYIAGVYTGTQLHIFANGIRRVTESTTENPIYTSAEDLIFGARDDGTVGHFDGILDEVRISAVPRSADWIAAQYLSMTESFITYGHPEIDLFGTSPD